MYTDKLIEILIATAYNSNSFILKRWNLITMYPYASFTSGGSLEDFCEQPYSYKSTYVALYYASNSLQSGEGDAKKVGVDSGGCYGN
jgi:hypothetical protein